MFHVMLVFRSQHRDDYCFWYNLEGYVYRCISKTRAAVLQTRVVKSSRLFFSRLTRLCQFDDLDDSFPLFAGNTPVSLSLYASFLGRKYCAVENGKRALWFCILKWFSFFFFFFYNQIDRLWGEAVTTDWNTVHAQGIRLSAPKGQSIPRRYTIPFAALHELCVHVRSVKFEECDAARATTFLNFVAKLSPNARSPVLNELNMECTNYPPFTCHYQRTYNFSRMIIDFAIIQYVSRSIFLCVIMCVLMCLLVRTV